MLSLQTLILAAPVPWIEGPWIANMSMVENRRALQHTKPTIVSLTQSRDNPTCKAKQPLFYSLFFGIDACTAFTASPTDLTTTYYKFDVSGSGITINLFSDPGCTNRRGQSAKVPFGGCEVNTGTVVDVLSSVPMPSPGRYLEGLYWGESGCDGNPVYMLADTACNLNPVTHTDQERDCGGTGVHRYSTIGIKIYSSTDNTCSSTHSYHPPEVDQDCHVQGGSGGVPNFGAKSVWCGAGCEKWRTLLTTNKYCDPPGGAHPVNLRTALGPNCNDDEAEAAFGECCFVPLGYDGGEPVGTSCTTICKAYNRYGLDSEYCTSSSRPSYGNCFCGPAYYFPIP